MGEQHKCFKELSKVLVEENTRLQFNYLNQNHVFVATERIRNLRDGKKAKRVVASYCPFCGEKLEV